MKTWIVEFFSCMGTKLQTSEVKARNKEEAVVKALFSCTLNWTSISCTRED